MTALPILPRVVIAETPDDTAALHYYALILEDRTMRLVNYFENEFDLPLAAFWRLVEKMEAQGYRSTSEVTEPVSQRGRGSIAKSDPDRARWASELREGGASYAEIAAIVGYRNANTAGVSICRYRREVAA